MERQGVYVIANRVTRKCYVGSSVDIRRRWATHRRDLRRSTHTNRYLQRAWAKHGEDAFAFVLVEEVSSPSALVQREQVWLDALRPFDRDRGYNLSPSACSILGYRFTTEQKANVSASLVGKPKSPEHRANLWATRDVTDTQRQQMAAVGRSGAGVPKTTEHRRRIGEAQTGSGNHRSKLTDITAGEILRRSMAGERTSHLAAEFGVSDATVSHIKSRRSWRHLPTPAPLER